MRILYYPDPVLRRRADAARLTRQELRELVDGMLQAMQEARGVGLAAPQVGRSVRVFVASESGDPADALVCVNPVLETSGPIVEMEEGCLSLPGVHAQVARPSRAKLRATDVLGEAFEVEAEGLLARIFQHEMDHLDGILFFDRLSPTERTRIEPELRAFEEQYRPS
jgi:peptide deformylase